MSFSWQDIWQVVKRWWWLVVVGVLLAGGTSYYFASQKPNVYSSRVRLMVGSGIRSVDPNSQDFGLSQTLAQIYAEMARLQPITQGVVDRLELPMGWWELAGRIQTRVIPQAQLLEITVLDTNPEFAAAAANAVAAELIRQSPASASKGIDRDFVEQQLVDLQAKITEVERQVHELEDNILNLTSAAELEEARTRLEELEQLRLNYSSNYVELASILNSQSPNTLEIVEPANPSYQPVAPSPKKEAAVAAMAGLMLSLAGVLFLEFIDDTLRIHDPGIESLMGLPVLGSLSRMSQGRCTPRSPAAEMVRQLRTQVVLAFSNRSNKSLVVSSPLPKDGKTTAAGNLAQALASGGSQVLLIDADLRAPLMHEWFDQPNLAGLTDLLNSEENEWQSLLPQLLRDTRIPNLFFMSSGRPPLDPSILLTLPRLSEILELLSQQFDYVLFDSPPVLIAPDAMILSKLVQGTLLIVSPGRTGRKATRRAIDNLTSTADTRIIGIALNRMPLQGYTYKYVQEPTSPKGPLARLRHAVKGLPVISTLPVIGGAPAPGLISTRQAADILGVRGSTVQRWCKEGRLPAEKHWLQWWIKEDRLLAEFVTGIPADARSTDASNGRSQQEDIWTTTDTAPATELMEQGEIESTDAKKKSVGQSETTT
jgi:capsular exopolysaccharide synthesis family protein